MINPKQITDFNRSKRELEMFWIFCLMVAGKNSDNTAKVVARLFQDKEEPFIYLQEQEFALRNTLVANRTGQYYRYERAIKESIHLNLFEAGIDELEAVYGIGPKTSRFFLLHSREGAEHVVLDTHVLKWLKMQGMDVPVATPTDKKKYRQIEAVALGLIKAAFPGLTMAQADLLIWSSVSGRLEEEIDPIFP